MRVSDNKVKINRGYFKGDFVHSNNNMYMHHNTRSIKQVMSIKIIIIQL